MAAKSREGSETDHIALPEEGSQTVAVNTKGELALTLLVLATIEVNLTTGAPGGTILTMVEAVASRAPAATRMLNVDVVPSAFCEAHKLITDICRILGATTNGHCQLLSTEIDCEQAQRYHSASSFPALAT